RPCAKRSVSNRSFCAAALRNGAVSSLQASPPDGSPAALRWFAADESALLRDARTSEPLAPDLPSGIVPQRKAARRTCKASCRCFFPLKKPTARERMTESARHALAVANDSTTSRERELLPVQRRPSAPQRPEAAEAHIPSAGSPPTARKPECPPAKLQAAA